MPRYFTRRSVSRLNAAILRFNERLTRLREIHNSIATDFVDKIIDEVDGKEADKIMLLIDDMQFWNNEIEENIEIANNSHLSKYATRIKKVALYSIDLCRKYEIYNNINEIEYNAKEKMIYLEGDELYYFG